MKKKKLKQMKAFADSYPVEKQLNNYEIRRIKGKDLDAEQRKILDGANLEFDPDQTYQLKYPVVGPKNNYRAMKKIYKQLPDSKKEKNDISLNSEKREVKTPSKNEVPNGQIPGNKSEKIPEASGHFGISNGAGMDHGENKADG